MKKKGSKGLTAIIIILLIVIGLFLALISFITDFLWFNEMGYVSVFLTKLFTQLKIGIPVFIIVGLLSFAYLVAIKKGYYKKIESHDNVQGSAKKLKLFALGLSAIFAALVTYFVTSQLWFEVLKFLNSTSFNLKDPLMNMDISFYLFKLDLIKQLTTMAIGLIIGLALLTVLYYMLMMSLRKPQIFEEVSPDDNDEYEDEDEDENGQAYGGNYQRNQGGFNSFNLDEMIRKLGQMLGFPGGGGNQNQNQRRPQATKKQFDDENLSNLLSIASKQLIALGVVFFIMVSVTFFLKQYDLLYSSTGVLYGAGYTDVTITLWMYRLLVVLSLAAAVGFVIGVNKKKLRTILTVPVIMILIAGVGVGATYIVQNFIVSPDEINKEREYLARNIKFTQAAYKLDNVSIRDFAATDNLTLSDVANNMETISNIRINDYNPVRRFYNNVQTIRPYYVFNSVNVDRYMINGEYTQTFLSAREIDDSPRSPIPQTWMNKHIKYTHGYGVTLSRVNEITASGQPDMMIRNIPPNTSDIEEIDITNPAVYFGELTRDYILVKTNEPEFDYPKDSNEEGDNAETIYDGGDKIRATAALPPCKIQR